MSYADQTNVSVEKTEAAIKRLLKEHGSKKTLVFEEEDRAIVQCIIADKGLRFVLPLPSQESSEFKMTPKKRFRRTNEEAFKAWEQACRSRWRALLLILKAKFAAIEAGILTFEEVFLAHILLPNKQTVGEFFVPQIESVYANHGEPLMLPGMPEKMEVD